MKHLIRGGGLLALLVFVFLLLRLMPIPEAMEPYGFYRGQGNEAEWASQPVRYADPVRCSTCHQDKHGTWEESEHSTVSCENCHGPGEEHVEKQVSLVLDTSREACGVCHAKLLARPDDFPQVDLKEHGGQSECIACHNPHDPQTATALTIPHALEGRGDCLLCHSAGGIAPFPGDHEGRSQSTCLNCHEGK